MLFIKNRFLRIGMISENMITNFMRLLLSSIRAILRPARQLARSERAVRRPTWLPARSARAIYLSVIAIAVLMLVSPFGASSHEVKIPVVVDTDVALDDIRAITLLLQDDHFDLLAIVTSDGACDPRTGAENISKMLAFMNRMEIPVGKGKEIDAPDPPWRSMSEEMGGADLPAPSGPKDYRGAIETIHRVITSVDAPVTYICLGPLTNLAGALERHPSLKENIGAIYYYGTVFGGDNHSSGKTDTAPVSPSALKKSDFTGYVNGPLVSWNTVRDTLSAAGVASADLPLYCCSIPDSLLLVFDKALYDQVTGFDTRGSRLMERMYSHGRAAELLGEGHFRTWDETVILCLIEPLLAEFDRASAGVPKKIYKLISFDIEGARAIYLDSFQHAGQPPAEMRKTVVFGHFPSDPNIVREDIRPLIGELIDRHGYEEWRASVLTNEIHRHLGIYSLLGVKMGIRAREILGATLDDLEVVSYAGLNPPLSCMNDGLQVSTGATLGRGTIRVETSNPYPGAAFIKGDESVRLKLKDHVVAGIKKDIAGAIKKYGSLTPEYFAEIRRLSIRYWVEMDREDIFDTIRE